MLWRQTWAVLVKDLTIEWRTRQVFNAVVFFAVLVLFIFSFALGPQTARQRDLAAGLLWLAFVSTGLLGLGQIFQVEQENRCLEGLVLFSRNCIPVYVGRVLATVAFLLTVEGLILVMLAVLYNVDLWRYLPSRCVPVRFSCRCCSCRSAYLLTGLSMAGYVWHLRQAEQRFQSVLKETTHARQ